MLSHIILVGQNPDSTDRLSGLACYLVNNCLPSGLGAYAVDVFCKKPWPEPREINLNADELLLNIEEDVQTHELRFFLKGAQVECYQASVNKIHVWLKEMGWYGGDS